MSESSNNNNLNEEELSLEEDAVLSTEAEWNRLIRQYDLLSEEEVVVCGKDLKLVKELFILTKFRQIDLDVVLSNLTNNNAQEIISKLLKMYLDIHEQSLSNEEELVLKYQKKYKELGRVLNEEELQEIGIKKKKEIGEDVLLEQVNKYVKYNTSKYKMFHANLRLIPPVAQKYSEMFKIDKMDLIQEGNVGLMKAVNNFDVDKGFKFSTYAMWCIYRTILRYVSINYAPVKTSTHYWEQHREFQKRVKELEEETGRKFSASELAKILDMEYETVLDFVLFNPNVTYLDQRVGDDEDTTIGELIPAEDVDFNAQLVLEELREVFKHYIHKLPPKTAKIISMLYGINDEKRSYTEEEIMERLKITKGVITTQHNKALVIIRNLVRRNGKKDHLQYFK